MISAGSLDPSLEDCTGRVEDFLNLLPRNVHQRDLRTTIPTRIRLPGAKAGVHIDESLSWTSLCELTEEVGSSVLLLADPQPEIERERPLACGCGGQQIRTAALDLNGHAPQRPDDRDTDGKLSIHRPHLGRR